ncbi:hypothetical protein M7I_0659 [Glarea lozoyensis 74030]|uniref:BTB domain-containing protein n=1 Tax=Glarea lozoyensis (strain ATCC 74030 / MF5533) TaxID=1104152 RepID=H0EDL0_GLAL7|nr:hypothetical protein M7I_0659 [Glarea lozoyensis 74030]
MHNAHIAIAGPAKAKKTKASTVNNSSAHRTIVQVMTGTHTKILSFPKDTLVSTSEWLGRMIDLEGYGTKKKPVVIYADSPSTYDHLKAWIFHKRVAANLPMHELQNIYFEAERMEIYELMNRIGVASNLFSPTKIAMVINRVYAMTKAKSLLRELYVEVLVGKFIVDSETLGDADAEGVNIGRDHIPQLHTLTRDNVDLFTDFSITWQYTLKNDAWRPWEKHGRMSPDDPLRCKFHHHGRVGASCYAQSERNIPQNPF